MNLENSPDNEFISDKSLSQFSIKSSISVESSGRYRLPGNVLSSESEILRKLAVLDQNFLQEVEFARNNDLMPFVTQSKLYDPVELLVDIDKGVEKLTIYRINSPISVEDLNGDIDLALKNADLEKLVEIPNPTLTFSPFHIARYSNNIKQTNAFELYTRGKRITRYDGVSVTWDQSIDRKVWTTNIDTVHFLRAIGEYNLFSRGDVDTVAEIGVGGGGLLKYVKNHLPEVKNLIATDISSYALMCAARNIRPLLASDQSMNLFLGKGLQTLDTRELDLLLVNPPYIPEPGGPTEEDPYRGTGLIKEVVEQGVDFLNSKNPDACIFLGMSSLARKKLQEYLSQNPSVQAEVIGGKTEVPLKILDVNKRKEWLRFLVEECDLKHIPKRLHTDGFEYWHEIYVVKLSRDSASGEE